MLRFTKSNVSAVVFKGTTIAELNNESLLASGIYAERSLIEYMRHERISIFVEKRTPTFIERWDINELMWTDCKQTVVRYRGMEEVYIKNNKISVFAPHLYGMRIIMPTPSNDATINISPGEMTELDRFKLLRNAIYVHPSANVRVRASGVSKGIVIKPASENKLSYPAYDDLLRMSSVTYDGGRWDRTRLNDMLLILGIKVSPSLIEGGIEITTLYRGGE